jgi:hypothetical protein
MNARLTNKGVSMAQKKVGRSWFVCFKKSEFSIGFDVSKYGITLELGMWYAGVEF